MKALCNAIKLKIRKYMTDQINKKVNVNIEELLKSDAPYLVEDGKINLVKLKSLLADKAIEKEDDRFYFNWAGKDKIFEAIQAPAYSTLAPQKDKSIGWNETDNLMIVGENLETLKLLLKPYFGKVKVIYIDPPYNTGKDFIYKDNFSSPLKDYLEKTGQKDGEGVKLTTNAESGGRYHSDWLNFMYSRLFVSRNLLQDDGVIFISIDDNEVHHLRMIMDEIYGEDNFIAMFVWKTRQASGKQVTKQNISTEHEYLLCYQKMASTSFLGEERDRSQYTNPDNDPRGDWAKHPLDVGATRYERPNCFYELTDPDTGITYKANENRVWAFAKPSMHRLITEKKILFSKNGTTRPYLKKFWSELKTERKPISTWIGNSVDKNQNLEYLDVGYNTQGTKTVNDLFAGKKVFDYPKPVSLIQKIIQQTTKDGDLILDFFAGSGTTGHAVYELSKQEKNNRKFILVQIPEEIIENSEAYNAGYRTISDICIDRLKKVSENENGKLSFKVFELKPSNFNLKQEFELAENKDLKELKNTYLKELGLYVDQPTVAAANALDIVYEIILKNGFSLNSHIEELKLGSNNFYKVKDTQNELETYISLDSKIEDDSVEVIRTTEYKGNTFAFYDNALTDSQKINLNTFVKLQVI